jgi:hypothetical protein
MESKFLFLPATEESLSALSGLMCIHKLHLYILWDGIVLHILHCKFTFSLQDMHKQKN